MKTYLKKNKPLLLLPLVLLPFVVLIFYILGGGENQKGGSRQVENHETTEGINYSLPGADRSIEIFDKLEAYRSLGENIGNPSLQAKDTLMLEKTNQKDPEVQENDPIIKDLITANPDQSELLAHIKKQEELTKKELAGEKPTSHKSKTTRPQISKSIKTAQAQRSVKPKSNSGITELDQFFEMNTKLKEQSDSLLNILNQKEETGKIQKVEHHSLKKMEKKGFASKGQSFQPHLLKAEVYETMKVLDGNRVKFRLLEDCKINNQKIATGSFFYGICKLKNERLLIQITQIPVKDLFIPVNLAIYDLDGLLGLYVPDQAARKVIKEVGSSSNTSSLFGVTTDPLTYAGVRTADRTAQSLFKMTRMKKVTIKKNTLVYLSNQK